MHALKDLKPVIDDPSPQGHGSGHNQQALDARRPPVWVDVRDFALAHTFDQR